MSDISPSEKVLDRSVFTNMTPGQQQHYFAQFGFVLLPNIVSAVQIERIATEAGGLQRYDYIERWPGPVLEELITNPKLLQPLELAYGTDLRFF